MAWNEVAWVYERNLAFNRLYRVRCVHCAWLYWEDSGEPAAGLQQLQGRSRISNQRNDSDEEIERGLASVVIAPEGPTLNPYF